MIQIYSSTAETCTKMRVTTSQQSANRDALISHNTQQSKLVIELRNSTNSAIKATEIHQ